MVCCKNTTNRYAPTLQLKSFYAAYHHSNRDFVSEISCKVQKVILRHLTAAFGVAIQVPLKQVRKIGDGVIDPKFGEFDYLYETKKKNKKQQQQQQQQHPNVRVSEAANGEDGARGDVPVTAPSNTADGHTNNPGNATAISTVGTTSTGNFDGTVNAAASQTNGSANEAENPEEKEKKPEKVFYWIFDLSELLAYYLGREIEYEMSITNNGQLPIWGYESTRRGEKLGVDLIVGADHGGGKSRYSAKVNLLSSYERRGHRMDFGAHIILFGLMECRLDKAGVQRKVKGPLNEGFDKLSQGKLVGIIDEEYHVCTKVVPKVASNVKTVLDDTTNTVKLEMTVTSSNSEGEAVEVQTLDIQEGLSMNTEKHRVWTVINEFSLFSAGDIKQLMIQSGRGEGNASCRYVFLFTCKFIILIL